MYNGKLVVKKNKIVSYIDGPRNYAQWCTSGKERKILYDITYMLNLKKNGKKIHLHTKQKQTHRCKIQTYCHQRGEGGNKGQIRIMSVTDINYCT